MTTSIILLTHNQLELTQACIESIRAYTPPSPYELIVVDNASTDGTVGWLKKQPDIRLIANSENVGFPRGCNQGMRLATGGRLLLLNNDTVVTPRWLEQLTACLESDERIGAVGPVTNQASYYTAVQAPYSGREEMLAFAEGYNRSDPSKWEERAKLIGYCLLLRREAYETVGELDERYSPGNFEDDDYCIRLRLAGYRLMLCADTFIHHEGSAAFRQDIKRYQQTIKRNAVQFVEKWGYSPNVFDIHHDMIGWIDEPRETPLRILELNCGGGVTLLELKDRYPNTELFGIERSPHAAELASLVASVTVGDPEFARLTEPPGSFDYILFGASLEQHAKPIELVRQYVPYLKDDGKLIARVANLSHYSVIRNLLRGEWSGYEDHSPLRYYTFSSLTRMMQMSGVHHLEYKGITNGKPPPRDEHWIREMARREGESMIDYWMSTHFLIKGYLTSLSPGVPNSPGYPRLKRLIRRLEWKIDPIRTTEEIAALFRAGEAQLLDAARVIERAVTDQEEAARKLARLLCERGIAESETQTIRALLGGKTDA
ncbi:glycosyltransferase [Cohnella lubricantis]|uniref:Glycosyltransferase n=1 Tax=Cohnella lubricantis TaxID=2163172 RepID=A0A841T8D2_9BACL|nr:glycosyltransferase [Cohnella lubricantis]MBB6677192.1 glycosyltransferase [Cohnella lubricantis]MBP2116997.1 GT2 family glycosyltransferase [Cohnella lubricantis]